MAQPTLEGLTLNAGSGGSDLAVETIGSKLWQAILVGYSTGDGTANVVMADTGLPVVAQSGSTWAVTQSGTWNITNVSGTISLPTGAATAANQTTANTSLATIAGDTTSLDGKVTACNTGAVVIASGTITTVSSVTAIANALPAGDNNIGNVDVVTAPGTAAEAAALPGVFVVVAGDDGTDTHPLQVDGSGYLKITGTAASPAVDNDAAVDGVLAAKTYGMYYDGSAWDRVRGDSTNGLLVNLGTNNDVIQPTHDNLNANANVQQNNADVATGNALFVQPGTGAVFQVQSNSANIATQTTAAAIQTAVELIDNAVSGAGFNITQFAGAAVPIGAGTEAAAVRVTLATDSTGTITVDTTGTSGLEVVQATAADLNVTEASASAIKAAVEIMDDWDDGADHCEIVDANTATLGTTTYSEGTTKGPVVAAVRNDDLATLANTDNEAAPLQVNAEGALYVCDAASEIKRASGVAAGGAPGTDDMIAAVAARYIRVLALGLFATSTTTNNVFVDNADNDLLFNSGNPLPLSLDADGDTVAGFVLPYNPGGWFQTDTVNEAVTLNTSAAQDIAYTITYIEVP